MNSYGDDEHGGGKEGDESQVKSRHGGERQCGRLVLPLHELAYLSALRVCLRDASCHEFLHGLRASETRQRGRDCRNVVQPNELYEKMRPQEHRATRDGSGSCSICPARAWAEEVRPRGLIVR